MKKKSKKALYIRLFIVLFLVVSNTFAWFIYITKVDNNINVHVKSWDVTFQSGDKEIVNTVHVNIDNLYPGMEDYIYEITAYNKSEVSATLSYSILEARIFDSEYVTVEGRTERNETPLESDFTSAQLEQKFANDYPFTLSIGLTNSNIAQTNGNELFSITVVWPYEGASDYEDTRWGISAANYKNNHPSSPSMTLKIKIEITQNPD